MAVTNILVLAALCATAAHAGPSGDAEHSARLEARVEAALESMLGPGRAAAVVEVRGERVTKREQSQISGSSGREQAGGGPVLVDLPGYTKKGGSPRPASGGTVLTHSAVEETLHEGSFVATGVRARLVLDEGLGEASVAEAVRVTREILSIDEERGDRLTVVRTSFLPAWRAAFSRPRDARALLLVLAASAALLLAAGAAAWGATRSSRVVAEALAASRTPPPPPAPPAPVQDSGPRRAHVSRRISPLPPLEKGGPGP